MKLKILHLIQKPQNRGAETFASQLANHQKAKGNIVKIVSVFDGKANLPWKEPIDSINASKKFRFLDFNAWRNLNKIIREFNPDLIQANAGDTLKYAVFSKKIYGWDYPIFFRNASEVGRYLKSPFQKKFNSFLYKNVDHIVSVSRASEKDILMNFPFLENKTTVIPVGLESISNIKELELQPNNSKHVIHVGGFSFEKNHEALIRIFEKLSYSISNIHLHLIGDGPLRSRIESIVEEKGLSSKITFHGYIDEPLPYIKAADVLVLPSIIEGLPAVLLEAMYCETSVIAYGVGGIKEIVFSGKTGKIIQKNDENGFVDALKENLQQLPNEGSEIMQAKKMVSEKFSNDFIATQFLQCYRRVFESSYNIPEISEMKILQLVTKRQYRGAELFAADLSKELIDLGHQVYFIGIYDNEDQVLEVEGAVNRDLVNSKRGMFSIRVVKELVKYIKDIKPDVIQCNGSDTLKYAIAASLFTNKIPLVYRNISIISEWVSNKPKKILYKRMFNRIAHVTSVGDEALADFIKTYKYPTERAEVIRRGIPIKGVNRMELSNNLRKNLSLKNSDKIVIHIGNFSPEKNHEFLINIFSDLKETQPHIKLICVGSGILFEEIKGLIKLLDLRETVFLLGFRQDIPELLAASDCIVLTSKVEGVPGVILEAGTQKIPAVATNVGGVKEALIDGKTGFLIDGFDRTKFKNKLVELMTDDILRKKFGENAYEMISKGYDPKLNARKFEKLYQRLIEESV
mgnify:CR=1 FL=1